MHANAIKTDGRMGGLAKIERGTLYTIKTDGWMGGLAKISEGTLHLFQGAWFEPFGQHVFGDA